MAFLGLLLVASLFAADGNDLLPVAPYDPTKGEFYDCSSITVAQNPDPDVLDAAIQKCIDTKWCVWNNGGGTAGQGGCVIDRCLKSLGDTAADMTACTTISFGSGCQVMYLVDGVDCTTFDKVQTSRFCRAVGSTNVAVSGVNYIRGVVDDCFYTDLSSIGQDWTGSRKCTGATCGNITSSAGGYCAVNGTDCSIFSNKDSDEYCNCLGANNCDLYPHCFKSSSSTCVYDQCTDPILVNPSAQNEQGICNFASGLRANNCKIRPQYTYTSGTAATLQWVCVNKEKSHANECYYAVKSTKVPGNIPAAKCQPTDPDVPCDYCDTYTYDESICTTAPILANDGGAGVTPGGSSNYQFSDTTNCSLVDIAEKYIGSSKGKYCTDGDRTVPSPDAGSLVRIPSAIAFGLVLLVAIIL